MCLGIIKSLRGQRFRCVTRPQLSGSLDFPSACFFIVLLGREREEEGKCGKLTHETGKEPGAMCLVSNCL